MQQTGNGYDIGKKLFDIYEQRFYIVAHNILKDEELAECAVEIAVSRLITNRTAYAEMGTAEAREYAIRIIEETSAQLYLEYKDVSEEQKGLIGWIALFKQRREERLLPAVILLNRLTESQAEELLGELPRRYQQVLDYRYVKHMSVAEAAAMLNCSENMIQRRDVSGRRLLLRIVGYAGEECYDKNVENMLGDEDYVYKTV